jgi:hypothetical protein
MASALITLQIISTLLLLYIPWTGMAAVAAPLHSETMRGLVAHHIFTAFPAFTLAVFAHSMSMFYFIGTGRTVKDARKKHPETVTEADVKETIRYKRVTSPLFTFAILLLIAAPISGGPLLRIPREGPGGWLALHLITVIAALALQIYTAIKAVQFIRENVRLLDAIDARLLHEPAAASAGDPAVPAT